ncbi:hypothetical protein Q8A73_003462 [Channa argus]|nr:hypothetical protein Q8A73_003462 [Channa argus]
MFAVVLGRSWLPSTSSSTTAQHINIGGEDREEEEKEEEAEKKKQEVASLEFPLLCLQAKAYTEQQQAEKTVLYCFRPAGKPPFLYVSGGSAGCLLSTTYPDISKLGNQTAREANAQTDRQRETREERGVTATAARLTGRSKGKKIQQDRGRPRKQH